MSRILFVLPSFGGGGAERVVSHLVRFLTSSGHDVTLLTFSDTDEYGHTIPPDVRRVTFGKRGALDALRMLLRLTRFLKKARPDVMVSFLHYANIICAIARKRSGCACPWVLSERNHPPNYLRDVRFRGIVRALMKRHYPQADRVIAVTAGVAESLVTDFNVSKGRIEVIPNPVPVSDIRKRAGEGSTGISTEGRSRVVLSAGRLSKQKRPDRLMRIFARVSHVIPDVTLVVLGSGELEGETRKLAGDLGISDRVEFKGFVENPYVYMSQAAVFCLTSDYEGFPNVIVEAMALGCPVVATDCLTGPRDILEHGVTGLLAPIIAEETFASHVRNVLLDDELRHRLSTSGRLRAEDFDIETLLPVFEEAIVASTGTNERNA